jgi:GTP pyrophosphokinase
MYTLEEKAIRLVTKAFENQRRLKDDICTSVHSITVGFMLKEIGATQDTIIGGLLHDIIEDTPYDYDYIKNNYSEHIADLVLAASENQTIKVWKKRKIEFIERTQNASEEVLLIELADKFHNLVSDYETWEKEGNESLKTNVASYEENKWYYLEMQKLFNSKLTKSSLLDRYNEICKIYFEN